MEAADTHTQPNAPGCFAAPSVFSHDSQVCGSCPAFDSCAAACVETLKALREQINVEDILAKHRLAKASTIERAKPEAETPKFDVAKFLPSVKKPESKVERKVEKAPRVSQKVPVHHQTVVDGILSKKPRELAAKWCKHGMIDKMRQDLAAGTNPFAAQARQNFESVTCDLLLNGGLTKQSLKKAFMSSLGAKEPWDERTAASHVNIILPALVAFDIAIETPEGFALNPRLRGDNV